MLYGMVDTGATLSAISATLIERYKWHDQCLNCNAEITVADDRKVKIDQWIWKLKVAIPQAQILAIFDMLISPAGSWDVLIGRNTLSGLEADLIGMSLHYRIK